MNTLTSFVLLYPVCVLSGCWCYVVLCYVKLLPKQAMHWEANTEGCQDRERTGLTP